LIIIIVKLIIIIFYQQRWKCWWTWSTVWRVNSLLIFLFLFLC